MIFVGYESGSKGYKFWNPANRSIVVSRDVTFDEESFPARKLPGNHPVTPDDHPFPDDQSDKASEADVEGHEDDLAAANAAAAAAEAGPDANEEARLEQLYDEIAWPLGRKYGHPYDAFKLALT